MNCEIHPNAKTAGEAAAQAAAQTLWRLENHRESIGIVFATGASQLDTLHALTTIPDLPWNKIIGFHLDEYMGIDENHLGSFRHYLRKNLTEHVSMKEFFEIDGSSPDPDLVRKAYVQKLNSYNPRLCLLGIGENGHLAFNDPGEANFNDPDDMKIVTLDATCRQQQAAEGWFENFDAVPKRALTLTIPAIFRIPKLILSVPGNRKAKIVRRMLEGPISTDCPATILRTHPDATIYLDEESAAELDGNVEAG